MRNRLILLALAAAPAVALADEAPKQKPPETPAQAPAKAPASPAAKSEDHTVGAVVVTAERPAVQTAIDRRSYSVASDLQAQTGSIGDALRNVPSLQVDVQGNVSLRGDPNVTILIDGKPSSAFEGDSKAQSLQALPANQIERVEVITNPSAEFRADGTGGVINLVTKKAKGAGRTGSAKLTGGSGGRAMASAAAGYNSPNLSLTGDVNLRHDSQKQIGVDDRLILNPATGGFDVTHQFQDQHSTLDMDTARVAIDYDLGPKTRLSAELRGTYYDFTVGGPTQFERTSAGGVLTGAFQRDLDLHQIRAGGAGTVTLRRKFDAPGHELTLSATYDDSRDDRMRAGRTATRVPAIAEAFDRQLLNYDYRRTQLKGDYVRPMGDGGTLKLGFDLQRDDNSYGNTGFRGPLKTALALDPTLTNLFLFEQKLSQGYVTYEQRIGDFGVLAGVRLEDVRIDLDQVTLGQKDRNDYRRAYPSLHLTWKLGGSQKLTASYSHRVQRPNPLQFNTFRVLLDPLSYRAGNAYLKPQETHSYEVGYEYRGSPTLYLATLYYRENFNGFGDVVRDIGGGVVLMTSENISKSRSAGLELVANGKLTRDLSYNLSTNLYWAEIAPQLLGAPGTRTAVTASGRANLTWQASPTDLVQLNAFLNGKQLTPQGYFAPMGALNLGYRHKFDDRFAFVFTAQDLLHTVRFRQVVDTPVLKSRTRGTFDSRQVQAGFIWTFGGGRQRDPGFDFGGGGGAPPQ